MWKTIARFLKDKENEPEAAPSAPEGFHLPLSARQLLSKTERRTMMVRIWENTSLPKETYQSLCLAPLHACAEVMQQFPMSSAGKFAYQGGAWMRR
ncbi:hypothetical protein BBW68_04935 [Candidatus Erwinia dacicola]|uniref:Helicase family protein n=1 Tax=Candidatus Erwinia dacicola TaxID=252393 RepID=A0A1E7Z477_9GAMM|nr:TraI domain-containing protein [Candidatus Erwinia dacicola]OFC63534.1 hypothetical protein BBW68_04935 [Candidatus Erwinia dacicola]RAP69739.1 helicase family protein [Candidatus Erwinia dacicola]